MREDVIVVFTYKTLDQMRKESGCGHWPIGNDPEHLSKRGVEYVICVRNRSGNPEAPPEGDPVEHGKPFLVGRLKGAKCVDAYTDNGVQRQLLIISEYAELPHKSLPRIQVLQNFKYSFASDLAINLSNLHFAPFAAPAADGLSLGSGISVFGNDRGPTGDGERSHAVWSARQSPLANKIVTYLRGQGWEPGDGRPWKPDILMRRKEHERVLIEVKPDFGTHNVITGIGQIICYRSPHEASLLTSIIAGEGIGDLPEDLRMIMSNFGIRGLDVVDPNWPNLLETFLRESRQNWRVQTADGIASMTPKRVKPTSSGYSE